MKSNVTLSNQQLDDYIRIIKSELEDTLSNLNIKNYKEATHLIHQAEDKDNRIHITGIGKPSHVARYIASLLSSTGTPTYFLDGTEAVHGSCGQLKEGDVVICISNSGETEEMKSTVRAVKSNNCSVIAVTGVKNSWIDLNADTTLWASVSKEGVTLNRAPRASIISEVIVLQGLSIVLQSYKNLTPQQYIKWHPGGSLGHLREDEK